MPCHSADSSGSRRKLEQRQELLVRQLRGVRVEEIGAVSVVVISSSLLGCCCCRPFDYTVHYRHNYQRFPNKEYNIEILVLFKTVVEDMYLMCVCVVPIYLLITHLILYALIQLCLVHFTDFSSVRVLNTRI